MAAIPVSEPEYVVKQVVEFTWMVRASSATEAARIAMDAGIAKADAGRPTFTSLRDALAMEPTLGDGTDLRVNEFGMAKVWRYNSRDILELEFV